LDENNFITAEIEDYNIKGSLAYIIKAKHCEVVLYGASLRGYVVLCWLKSKGIEPLYMVDADISKHGTRFFGIETIHIDSLEEKIRGKNIYALVCTDAYIKNFEDKSTIDVGLRSAGCGEILLFPCYHSDQGFWSMYYKTQKDNLVSLYDELGDEKSKLVLYEFVRSVIYDKPYLGEITLTGNEKYFAPDLYDWSDDECVVDCGANNGDSIVAIIEAKGSFGKIYAIEADWDLLQEAKELAAILPEKIAKKIEFYHAVLGSDGKGSLDVMLKGLKVTMIKMDIEGAELKTLEGARKIIAEQMPVLAICVYHKKEDLVEIPAFIKNVASDYQLYLRKYPGPSSSDSMCEVLLYAIPKNRMLASRR
jgi:hypothetical protein